MLESIKLVKLDCLTMKNYYKQIIGSYLIVGIAIIPNVPFVINILYFIIGAVFLNYPFMLAEQNNMANLYNTLPITKQQIVRAKYVSLIIYALGILLMLIPVNALFYIFLNTNTLFLKIMSTLVIGISLYVIVGSIQIPCYLKFGYAKAKIVAMVLPVIIGIGIPVGVLFIKKIFGKELMNLGIQSVTILMEQYFIVLIVLLGTIAILSMIVSYCIAKKIYR
ncbi:MAG: ABC-2 transporter permease [Cellulosilyticaceae bacterium]